MAFPSSAHRCNSAPRQPVAIERGHGFCREHLGSSFWSVSLASKKWSGWGGGGGPGETHIGVFLGFKVVSLFAAMFTLPVSAMSAAGSGID